MNNDDSWIAASGALAGLMSDMIVHPLDTIRTRIQTQHLPTSHQYTSSTHALQHALKTQGYLSLWRGFKVVALGTVPAHALYFYTYERMKAGMADGSVYSHLMAGLGADAGGSLIWCPMDVIKQRMQISNNQKHSMSMTSAVGQVFKESGIRGFYRGFAAGILTYGPYVSLYFAMYEEWKRIFNLNQPSVALSMCLLGAGLSGAVSAVVTCPLDVIKTRIQTSTHGDIEYKSWIRALKTIWTRSGPRTFFAGVGPRALWMSAGTATTMTFYECFKRI